jgi:dsDNA-specific endonuclease/ATPase MutS2
MIKEGDHVALISDTTRGVVISLLPQKKALVLTNDGFENTYLLKELVKVLPQSKKLVEIHSVPVKDKPISKKTKISSKQQQKGMEVDLHIHELSDHWKHLTNGQIVQLQLDHLKRKMQYAMKNKLTKVIIIHGKGEGVLRAEVRNWLNGFDNVEYLDASYMEYGAGATEVKIWYK